MKNSRKLAIAVGLVALGLAMEQAPSFTQPVHWLWDAAWATSENGESYTVRKRRLITGGPKVADVAAGFDQVLTRYGQR